MINYDTELKNAAEEMLQFINSSPTQGATLLLNVITNIFEEGKKIGRREAADGR